MRTIASNDTPIESTALPHSIAVCDVHIGCIEPVFGATEAIDAYGVGADDI
jgi:hypothetical protein